MAIIRVGSSCGSGSVRVGPGGSRSGGGGVQIGGSGGLIVRVGGGGGSDKESLKWLEELASKAENLSDSEFEEALHECKEEADQNISPRKAFEMKKSEYKQEKAREAFEEGAGDFKRADD